MTQRVSAQHEDTYCLTHDSAFVSMSLSGGSQACSFNGWALPASGTISILVIFCEVAGSNGSPNWQPGQLPSWANQFVDVAPSTNPQGLLTKYFYEASSGNLNVVGDYLVSQQNGGVFTFSSTGLPTTVSTSFLSVINTQANGIFLTGSGISNPLLFDNWTKTQPGLPKVTPSTDSPPRYDHVMIIWRDHPAGGNTGFASTGGFSASLLGFGADTFTWNYTGGSGNNIPLDICRHEFAHLILGGNNFHCAGGGAQTNYWIPFTGGHSMLGLNNSALRSWNGWDRYRLNWQAPANTHLISARNVSGQEVNGDLDATNLSQAGTYILKDFVTTGDAIRIKLPFLNPATEYEQWLWLENHRGYANNGSFFDSYFHQFNTNCVDPAEWGLSVAVQIDREQKCGPNIYASSGTNAGYMDYVRMLSADGMWEREFDANLSLDACTQWNNHYPSEKLSPNPLTGYGDLDLHPFDFNQNGFLVQSDQKIVFAEHSNGNTNWKLYLNGNPRQLFKLSKNEKIGMYTNPASAAHMNQVGSDFIPLAKNVRTVYLNGIHVQIMAMHQNGDMEVKIEFDRVAIEEDTRWCAPDIELNEIPTPSGYSLVVNPGRTLTLDHGTAATRMNNPVQFEGEAVFTDPTLMRVEQGAYINLLTGSELVIDRKSRLRLELGAKLYVQNGAVLRIKRDGVLDLRGGSLVQVADGGQIIVEGSSGAYGRGVIEFHPDARINLENKLAIIDLSGLIDIKDNAHFRLSHSGAAEWTKGRIFFRNASTTAFQSGTNATFSLRGSQPTQEVIVNEKTSMTFPTALLGYELKNLRVSQAGGCRMVPPVSNGCDIVIEHTLWSQNVVPPPPTLNHGMALYGQQNITFRNNKFEYCHIGVYSQSWILGHGFKIEASEFVHCTTAISTIGKHLILTDVEFLSCQNDWKAIDMTGTSGLQFVDASLTGVDNIEFEGNAILLGERSNIYHGGTGILLDEASGRFRCCVVRNHGTAGFRVINGGSLTMNVNFSRNDVTQNGVNIALNQAAALSLNNGENDLRPVTSGNQSIASGTLICPQSTLNANKNIWNNAGTAPLSADYYIEGFCPPFANVVTLIDNNPQTQLGLCLFDPYEFSGYAEGEGETEMGQMGYDSEVIEPASPMEQSIGALMNQVESDFFGMQPSSSEGFQAETAAPLDAGFGFNQLISTLLSQEAAAIGADMYFTATQVLIDALHRIAPMDEQGVFNISGLADVFEQGMYLAQAEGKPKQAFHLLKAKASLIRNWVSPFAAKAYLLSHENEWDENDTEVLRRLLCYIDLQLAGDLLDYPSHVNYMAECTKTEGGAKNNNKTSTDDDSVSVPSTFKMYPNPSNGFIQIEVEEAFDGVYTLQLYNSLGVTVFKSQFANDRGTIPLPQSIASGLYVAVISMGEVPLHRTVLILNR